MAAAGAAALDHVLTVGRAHANTEPVCLAPLSIVWLEGPLHRSSSTPAREMQSQTIPLASPLAQDRRLGPVAPMGPSLSAAW